MKPLLIGLVALVSVPAVYLGGKVLTSSADKPAVIQKALTAVTVSGSGGKHVFRVERAGTAADQERGLMFRTDIPHDGGMLFAPYPADGGAPKVATFWMKNTPAPLDIIFIRADRTIARIADNTAPFSETIVSSEEPVAAVLELNGGRAGSLGIGEGDKVSWRD